MSKDKKSKKTTLSLTLNDRIISLQERTEKLDYATNLTGAVKEYQQITSDIDTCEKEITTLYETLENENINDCLEITNENEFRESMTKIKDTIKLLEDTIDINKSLKYYNIVKHLINSCKKYETTLTASINEI
jgi:hypothetical protein